MTTSNNMTKNAVMIATAAVACAAGAAASAQSEPTWNRSVEAVAVVPDGTGGHEITVIVGAEAENLLTFGDLSVLVTLSINGTIVQGQTHQITSFPPGFPAGCPTCLSFQPCVCCDDSGICGCGGFVAPAPNSWNQALVPGDVISVVAVPAPGSLPEDDLSDNQLTVSFQGEPIYWQRRVVSAALQPSSAPGLFDAIVEWDVAIVNTPYPVDVSNQIAITVNGVFDCHHGFSPCEPVIAAPGGCLTCPTTCGTLSCSGWTVEMVCNECGPFPCTGGPTSSFLIAGLELSPGDVVEIEVEPILRGLPNLAGLPPLHKKTIIVPAPCPGDINGDGVIGVADLLQMLNCWGPVIPGCQGADLNGDNFVGVADLLQLLAQWGPCVP